MKGDNTRTRRPLRRRIPFNRHLIFTLHVLAYITVGIWIWTLPASTLDKRFDVLFWLALVSAHGIVAYNRRRVAFLFHLLMFAGGNGAIWSTLAPTEDKIKVTVGWVIVAALAGVWLFRRAVREGIITPRPPAAPASTPDDEVDEIEAQLASRRQRIKQTGE